ncbi:hypothetical protein MiSe_88620 [Microseira wollei NIES-4236]|uniref:Uncharacterized protein n=1 Tax=Microseira wollei NIES-4236 TaxID=2530354 RepID=A0AAV3XSF7_9CYAN|nr:hypothetical protein MiSe_88620 [Microseira wollei NIES-4236]
MTNLYSHRQCLRLKLVHKISITEVKKGLIQETIRGQYRIVTKLSVSIPIMSMPTTVGDMCVQAWEIIKER